MWRECRRTHAHTSTLITCTKELVKRGMQPMKDSELVHAFLERVITSLEVGASGAIVQRED
ncbi:hypothetical protein BWP29_20190 [Pseudomonas aeruginosa]|nr:hypothetical protein BWP29_20190 [Pseudomonas aeruginosa]